MGTLASQAEVGIWVQAPGGRFCEGQGVSPPGKFCDCAIPMRSGSFSMIGTAFPSKWSLGHSRQRTLLLAWAAFYHTSSLNTGQDFNTGWTSWQEEGLTKLYLYKTGPWIHNVFARQCCYGMQHIQNVKRCFSAVMTNHTVTLFTFI